MTQILLVEDNPITRKLVRFSLENVGYEVLDAVDGQTSVDQLNAHKVALVLLDLNLPDADGFEVLGKLREQPHGRDVPILAFSGMLSATDRARLSTVGFDDIVTKPIEPSRLVQIVRAHLPSASPLAPRSERRRIVLADDDAVQRKLGMVRLQRAGFIVSTASDGEEALALIRKNKPDAIVSDVLMPRLDGFGLCMAIRRDPELANTPILLISNSYLESDDVALAKRAGADDLLVRTPELTDVIARLSSDAIVERTQPPQPPAQTGEIERIRVSRMMNQLERQVAVQASLTQRCSLLAAELSVLSGISEALARQENIEAALHDVLASCLDAGGISVGMLYLRAPEGLRGVAFGSADAWNAADVDTFFGHRTLLESVIQRQELLALPTENGSAIVEGRDLLGRTQATSILIAPLGYRGSPQGALVMLSRSADLQASDRIAFSQAVAGQISVALALAASFKTAQQNLLVADRMSALGMLAAGVGHEINNPLMAVLGNLEMAEEDLGRLQDRHRGSLDLGELPETLRDARDAAARVRNIVRDLKLFSRGDVETRTEVSVGAVVESALRIVAHELKYKTTVVRDLQPVPAVYANEARLGQVVLNLIINAMQAMPERPADQNELRVATGVAPDGRVRVAITDNGVGMSPEVVARLFTPFFTTKPVGVGTGLGLAICHQLVTAVGGDITVDTAPGRGTTFTVLLPASAEKVGR